MNELPSNPRGAERTPDPMAETPETRLRLVRKASRETLQVKPGPIDLPENTSPDLAKLVNQFNAVLAKSPDQLTKSDAWDNVADFLTFLTWKKELSPQDTLLVNELHRKMQVFFGSQGYLEASGMMDAPPHYKYPEGLSNTLDSLNDKVRQTTVPQATLKGPFTLDV